MKKKIWYLDNIRLILAVFVVAWHAANAYIGGDWPVLETNTSAVIYGLKTFFDAITMPLFFYLSGYFVLSSIKKRGSVSFIKTKVKTILIPWIIVLLLVIPFIEMIGKIANDSLNTGYFDLWKWQMNRMLYLYFGIITDGFYQRYMWFLSVLFSFHLIFAIIYQINHKWFNKDTASLQAKAFTNRSALIWVNKIACLTLILMLAAILSIMIFTDSPTPEPFFSVFNVIQFQASRLPIYIVYFILGILTARSYWFDRDLFANRKLWNTLFAITGAIYLSVMNVFVNLIPDEVFGLLFTFSINFFIISTLGFALSNAKVYLDKPLFGNGEISSHAYNIYIIHYIPVYVLQLALLSFSSVPLLVKFSCVTLIALVLSIITSQYLLKPNPRLTVVIGIILTLIMFVVIN
jgi:glucan biosynthesis protein C